MGVVSRPCMALYCACQWAGVRVATGVSRLLLSRSPPLATALVTGWPILHVWVQVVLPPRTRSPAWVVAGYAWPSRVARLGVAQSSPVVDVLVHSLWLLGMEGMACRCLLATVPVEGVPMST